MYNDAVNWSDNAAVTGRLTSKQWIISDMKECGRWHHFSRNLTFFGVTEKNTQT
jgi:hypothetical protein